MNKLCLSLSFLVLAACSSPEGKQQIQEPALQKDTLAAAEHTVQRPPNGWMPYDERNITVPPYGLDTIKEMLGHTVMEKEDPNDEAGLDVPAKAAFAALTFRQLFTYHMIHPELYSQNCSIMPEHTDIEKRIYAQLPDVFGEYSWSDRQIAFFKDNRKEVLQLMKEVMDMNKSIGRNFTLAIIQMNATELIPYLVTFYRNKSQDHEILTVLMLLMKENKHPEFMESTSWKKLYGPNVDTYEAYLDYNKANEDLIMKRALNLYNGLSGN